MKKPESQFFHFEALLSSNSLCDTWIATELSSGLSQVVKISSDSESVSHIVKKRVLTDSYLCQKPLRFASIATATKKRVENGRVLISYPYLHPRSWQIPTPQDFEHDFRELIAEIALIVDYMHLLGLAHCDLKLDNFLINRGPKGFKVLITDLDFLSPLGPITNAMVFGTPGHIAPEILANDRVTVQSDNYSFGVMLRELIASMRSEKAECENGLNSILDKAAHLAERLTCEDYLDRPKILLEALSQTKLVDTPAYQSYLKRLFALLVISKYKGVKRDKLHSARGLGHFLTDHCRLFGLSPELISGFAEHFARSNLAAVMLFRDLIAESSLQLYNDFWHVSIPDEVLYQAYILLDGVKKDRPPSGVELARWLHADGRTEFAYLSLHCSNLGRDSDASDRNNPKLTDSEGLECLIELGRKLNRLPDVNAYLERLTKTRAAHTDEYKTALYEQAHLVTVLGQYDKLSDYLDRAKSEGLLIPTTEYGLGFLRLKAWLKISKGQYEEAAELLEMVRESANKAGFTGLSVQSIYNQGVLFFKRGAFDESEAALVECVTLADSHGLLPLATPALATLALLYSDTARYKKAVSVGKRAIQLGTEHHQTASLPFLHVSVIAALIRLGEYQKSEYWLERFRSVAWQHLNQEHVAAYYQLKCHLAMHTGEIRSAWEAAMDALSASDKTHPTRNLGKTYHNLAELAILAGDADRCLSCCQLATEIFEKLGDKPALAEISFLKSLCRVYYNGSSESILIHLISSLRECGSHYYASLCLYHALLNSTPETFDRLRESAQDLVLVHADEPVPLFRVNMLLMKNLPDNGPLEAMPVQVWKEAFRILQESNLVFLAMLSAQRIGSSYLSNNMFAAARKYTSHAHSLAEKLNNRVMTNRLQKQLNEIGDLDRQPDQMIEVLHRVSSLLSHVQDYEKSLRKLVEFALEQTGAERGAVLLRIPEGTELRPLVAANCDNKSLKDIVDFSQQIPRQAMASSVPVVIDDALTDKRTKQYKSILLHNIRSVVCVPLMDGQVLSGVLYLDHHGIPALFSDSDLRYVTAIGNFISMMLPAIQRVRKLQLHNKRLREEIMAHSGGQKFITNDPVMEKLLEQLPQIAKSRATILICGESGTGKEILCQMLHDLSQRSNKPLIKMNCAAISQSLIESELFGVAKNTATGVSAREGKFEAADGGTLFLDEIGDMPPDLQAKVLRVLEYQQFERVGSHRCQSVDVRIICATNKDIRQLMASGEFREDLYYRISTIVIEIPPLRKRPSDIVPLLEHFSAVFSASARPLTFSSDAMRALEAHSWAGNVRQLRNLVERCCILSPGQHLEMISLPAEYRDSSMRVAQSIISSNLEVGRIRKTLVKAGWNQSRAARMLSMPLSTLRRKMARFKIEKST